MEKKAEKKATLVKKANSNGQPDETPEQRFARLAQARVQIAIKRISLIGNLGGPNYKSTPEQRDKIKAALQEAVNRAVMQMNKEKAQGQVFTL